MSQIKKYTEINQRRHYISFGLKLTYIIKDKKFIEMLKSLQKTKKLD